MANADAFSDENANFEARAGAKQKKEEGKPGIHKIRSKVRARRPMVSKGARGLGTVVRM